MVSSNPPTPEKIISRIDLLKELVKGKKYSVFSYELLEYRKIIEDFYAFYIKETFGQNLETAFRLYREFLYEETYQERGKELLQLAQDNEVDSQEFEWALNDLEHHAYWESLEFLLQCQNNLPENVDNYLRKILGIIVKNLNSIQKDYTLEFKKKVFNSLEKYMESSGQEKFWEIEQLLFNAEKEIDIKNQEQLMNWLYERWLENQDDGKSQTYENAMSSKDFSMSLLAKRS